MGRECLVAKSGHESHKGLDTETDRLTLSRNMARMCYAVWAVSYKAWSMVVPRLWVGRMDGPRIASDVQLSQVSWHLGR
jgi:hypothetical protein